MHRHNASLAELRSTLNSLGTSDIPSDMVALLKQVWDDLDGAHDHRTHAYKLDRATGLRWHDPILTFMIDRHGRTVLGSTRAEIQAWTVDLSKGTAEATVIGQRQVRKRAKSLTSPQLQLIALDIAAAVAAGTTHPLFSYTANGYVRIHTRELTGDGPAQTMEGRRKRLHATLKPEMETIGWMYKGQAIYGPNEG